MEVHKDGNCPGEKHDVIHLIKTRSRTRLQKGLKKLFCRPSVCKKTFDSKASLDNHMKLHLEFDGINCESTVTNSTKGTEKLNYELQIKANGQKTELQAKVEQIEINISPDLRDIEPWPIGLQDKWVEKGVYPQEQTALDRTIEIKVDVEEEIIIPAQTKCKIKSCPRVHRGPYLKPGKMSCTICSKSFKLPSKMTQHMRTHSGEKPFSCDNCKRQFCTKSNLYAHMVVHTNIRAFQCGSCDRSFKTRLALNRHMLVHTGERPFKCTFCDKSFKLSSTLIRHRNAHKEVKKYVCDICSKEFHQKVNLKQHLLIHTGEKPYKCGFCDRAFTQSSNLKYHIRKIHPTC